MKIKIAILSATAVVLPLLLAGLARADDPSVEEIVINTKANMQNLASNIVAAAVCKDAQLDPDLAIGILIRADLLRGKANAQEIFLKALRASIEGSSANKDEWCRSTIAAAVARKSEMLLSNQGKSE
jgi:hypothetical protein